MHSQNLFAPSHIRTADYHAAVEASGPEQRRVKHIRPVRGGHQDDAFVRFEAVHLNQQLVQRLFALIVSAAQTSAAVASNSVDFVDEDDARSILLALLKQITHAACAHSDE